MCLDGLIDQAVQEGTVRGAQEPGFDQKLRQLAVLAGCPCCRAPRKLLWWHTAHLQRQNTKQKVPVLSEVHVRSPAFPSKDLPLFGGNRHQKHVTPVSHQ